MLSERIYLLVDGGTATQVGAALAGVPAGGALVQLRDKRRSAHELVAIGRPLREVTRRLGARLLVNDRVDVALAIDADGVHLPEAGLSVADARALLGPARLVGASAHGVEGALAKARAGADLVCVGPVWATPSKAPYGPPLGLAVLAAAAAAVHAGVPETAVFAVGGIEGAEQVREATRAGATGIAVIRAMMSAAELWSALPA